MTAFDMVTARITDSDGVTGVGYTVAHQGQGGPIAALCDGTFRSSIEGRDPDLIETIWRDIYKRHHYAGRGGPREPLRMAAVDVALWDLKGQAARHAALAAARRRQSLGQGLRRQHRPELPGGQAAGRRHGERRAGLPVGQDAARPPDPRRGYRPRRRDAQPSARRYRADGGRERGLAGGPGGARHDPARALRPGLAGGAHRARQYRWLRPSARARQGAAGGGREPPHARGSLRR